jgi:hypothetical protein
MRAAPSWYNGLHAGTNNKPKRPGIKRRQPEHRFQAALVKVLRQHGQCLWWAVPNGGHRHLHTAVKLKAEGVKPGVPDLHFVLPGGRIAFLELKSAKGIPSDAQQDFRDEARESGALWEMARNIVEAFSILAAWGVLPRGFDV